MMRRAPQPTPALPPHLAEARAGQATLDLGFVSLRQASDVEALADAIEAGGNRVAQLNAAWCGITVGGAGALARALGACAPQLSVLVLRDNELGDAGVAALVAALAGRSPVLRLLDLSANGLSSAACEPLARLVRGSPALRELGLRSNAITDAGLDALCDAIASSNSKLEEVPDTANPASARARARIRFALAMGAVARGDVCVDVSLDEAPKGADARAMDELFASLAQAFRRHGPAWAWDARVLELNMEGAGLSDAGVQALVPALAEVDSLRKISCGSSTMTDAGVRALSAYVVRSMQLEELDADGWCMADLSDALEASLCMRSGRELLLALAGAGQQAPRSGMGRGEGAGGGDDGDVEVAGDGLRALRIVPQRRSPRSCLQSFLLSDGDGALMHVVASFLVAAT